MSKVTVNNYLHIHTCIITYLSPYHFIEALKEYQHYSLDCLPKCDDLDNLKLSFFLHVHGENDEEKNMETILKQIVRDYLLYQNLHVHL